MGLRRQQATQIDGVQAKRNYITNAFAQVNTLGYVGYADAAGTVPVDGTGGTPTGVTFTVGTGSTPLFGASGFLINKDAANRQGTGYSYAFTVDNADRASVLSVSFDYKPSNGTPFNFNGGTYASPSDLVVYIYDTTNNVIIYPTTSFLDGSGKFLAQFQTASNGTTYRLIFHIATTNSSAWEFQLTNVSVGPAVVTKGAVSTDWIAFTPTGSWVTNTTYTGYYRRVGDSMEARVKVALTGAPTSAALTINLPSGLLIDTAKLNSATIYQNALGTSQLWDSSGGSAGNAQVVYSTTSNVAVVYQNSLSSFQDLVTQASPFTMATGDRVDVFFKVPIAGWSSNLTVSSDYGNRLIVAAASGTPTGPFNGTGNIVWPTEAFDTTASYNAGTGIFTAHETGYYQFGIGVGMIVGSGGTNQFFTLTPITTGTVTTTGSILYRTVTSFGTDAKSYSTLAFMTAESTIAFRASTNITGFSFNSEGSYFNVHKVQSPQTLAGGEVVAFRGANVAGTSIGTTLTTIPFVSEKDTHAAWNGTTYTVPVSGWYDIESTIQSVTATHIVSQFYANHFLIDSVLVGRGTRQYGTGSSGLLTSILASAIYLNQGQVITIQGLAATALALRTDPSANALSITKVG